MRTPEQIKQDIENAKRSDPELKLTDEIMVLTKEFEDLTERCNREANKEGNLRKLLIEVKDLVLKPRFQSEVQG